MAKSSKPLETDEVREVPLTLKPLSTLGELLLEYAGHHKMKWAALAEHLDTSEATLRRWRSGKVSSLSDKQMRSLVKITKIPFEVFLRVCSNYPVVYDMRYRRFETSLFDFGFVNQDVLRSGIARAEELYGDYLEMHGTTEDLVIGDDESNLELVFEYIENAYNQKLFTNEIDGEPGLDWRPLVREAARSFAPLNFIFKDPRGHYSGHIVTLPMKYVNLENKSYEYELVWNPKEKKGASKDKKEKDFRSPHNPGEKGEIIDGTTPFKGGKQYTLHIFSSWASHSSYAYYLLKRIARWVHITCGEGINDESCITGYPTTDHAKEMFKALGLTKEGVPALRKRYYAQTLDPPQFYSIELRDFVKKVHVDFRHDDVTRDDFLPTRVIGDDDETLVQSRDQDLLYS